MDSLDNMKSLDEWICSIRPTQIVNFLTHGSIQSMFERDYVIVTNICDGFAYMHQISMTTIEGAKERYKEFNKAILEVSLLSEEKKKEVSAQIDLNAEEQKKRWISICREKGITITK